MDKLLSISSLAALIVGIVLGIGWVLNIFYLFGYSGDVTAQFLLRLVGVFVVPLGGVMGYLG